MIAGMERDLAAVLGETLSPVHQILAVAANQCHFPERLASAQAVQTFDQLHATALGAAWQPRSKAAGGRKLSRKT